MTEPGVKVKLKRELGLLEITMIGLGPTIGSTIFLLVGLGIGIAGPALILAFVLNFVVTILTAMAYAELGSAFSDTGGGYMWVKEGMPQPFGFLAGWLSWFGHAIVTGFYVLGFGYGVVWLLEAYEIEPAGVGRPILIKILAVSALIAFIYINYRGTKTTGKSSNYITGVLVVIVLAYVVSGLLFIFRAPEPSENFVPFFKEDEFMSIAVAMGFTFIVFEGYEIIAQCGEECKDAEKNIPRAHWITISLAAVIFILVAIVTVGVVGADVAGIQGTDAVAFVAKVLMGMPGVWLIGIGVIIGALAAINSTLFSSSRVAFAMGRDGALPYAFGRLHSRRFTPHVAIVVSGGIILAMVIFLPIQQIAAAADIMFLLLMLFVNISVITLRYKKPDAPRLYNIPFFPWIPIAGIVTKAVMAVVLFNYEPTAWFICIFWIEIGLAAFWLYGIRERVEKPVLPPVEPALVKEQYRILIPVRSPKDAPLVEFGALISKVEGGEVYLTSVVEVPEWIPLDSVRPSELAEHNALLNDLGKVLTEAKVCRRKHTLVARDAADAILDEIRETDVNLLIVGWRGHPTRGLFYGRNLDRLINEAPCDVLLFKAAGMPKKVERILVVSKPEWHVTYAMSFAILLAKRDKAKIHILSCTTRKDKAKEKAYVERLEEMCKIHKVEYSSEMRTTFLPEREILNAARDYDIIVTGSGIEKPFLGPLHPIQESLPIDLSKSYASLPVKNLPSPVTSVFGTVQDYIARRSKKPVILMKKVFERPPAEPPEEE